MKRHKILVVALALAVMCTGAGYAYWTQALTIANTVNTGRMDVAFVCDGDEDWDDGYISGNHSDLVTVASERAADGQTLTFTVGNFYPGAGASLDFVVKNTGTVAAKISDVTGTITNNAALCDAFNYKFNKVKVFYNGIFTREEIIDVAADNVPDLAAGLTDALDDIILQPGEVLVLVSDGYYINPWDGDVENPGYEILMPSTIGGSDFETATASFSLGLNFTQVN